MVKMTNSTIVRITRTAPATAPPIIPYRDVVFLGIMLDSESATTPVDVVLSGCPVKTLYYRGPMSQSNIKCIALD